jgi:O-antigen/teichoic acid export membrane protein
MLANVLNYLYHMLCSRILGVTAYGGLATLVAGYSIINALATVINLTTVKLAAELHAADDRTQLDALLSAMTKMCWSIAAAIFVIFAVFSHIIAAYIHIDQVTLMIAIFAACAAIVVPSSRGILQGVQDYNGLSIATSIESIARLAGGIGLAMLGYGTGGAMGGFAIGSLLSLIYSGVATSRHVTSTKPRATLQLDTRRIIITSGGVTLATLALTLLGFIDVILAKHFFSPVDAGLYGVLSLTGKIIMFSVSFIPTILLPKAVQKAAKGESARNILLSAAGATLALSSISLFVFYTVPQLLIRVLAGTAFLAASPNVFPYGVATTLLAATTLVTTYLIGMHRFAFVPRLMAVAIAEILAICAFHSSITQVVTVVVLANAVGLVIAILSAIPTRKAQETLITQAEIIARG